MSKREEEKKSGSMLLWVILFLVFIGVGFAAKTFVPTPIDHERTIDVNLLRAEVQRIHELATMRYDYRESITKEKNGFLSTMFIATFDGTIKAGIDLDEVEYDVQNPVTDSEDPPIVTVSVPDAKILSHEDYNPETLYQEGYKSEGLGKERNEAIKKKKKEKQNEFIKAGHLDEAKSQAEDAIAELIHSSYGDDVVVTFEDIK